jgi:hypothetical protein
MGAFIVDYAIGKVIDGALGTFKTQVVERWSRHRAENFFDAFCSKVAQDRGIQDAGELRSDLNKVLADDVGSEILFDAYRRVTLTRSKTFGPRIIGVLTARLVGEGRTANPGEENVLASAESLTDDEFRGFQEFMKSDHIVKADGYNPKPTTALVVRWCDETFDSNWKNDHPVSVAPLDLSESLGPWAAKLKTHDLIGDDVRERQYEYSEDSERHVDQDGVGREISWWLHFNPSCFLLLDLTAIAVGAA